ncbi:MAG: hypothetical protein P8P74_04345 [Crocinitomicaceae bacterium]|nr:hypothetical protein [Crocinitomicaceae bacterium]
MIKKGFIALIGFGFVLSSCIKHEVIPPPTPMADLSANFSGVVNNTQTEFTTNVLGYENTSYKVKVIQPPGGNSTAVYYSEMQSASQTQSVAVGLGSVNFDSGVASDPPLALFEPFFPANDNPAYSNAGAAGFEVVYTDATNREWRSSETSNYAGATSSFTGIQLESDATGDYSKFICSFDCYVYSLNPDSLLLMPPVAHVDSFLINDAVYTGWFQR